MINKVNIIKLKNNNNEHDQKLRHLQINTVTNTVTIATIAAAAIGDTSSIIATTTTKH
jgi:hypothetical protein